MAASINLLPTDFKAGKEVNKAAELLKKANIALASIFVLILVLGGGFLFLQSRNLSNLNQRGQEVRGNIASLESTEQKIVLIKDRITHAQQLIGDPHYVVLQKFQDLITAIPSNTTLAEVELSGEGSKIVLQIPTSTDLITLMSLIKNPQKYTLVEVESLDFNPSVGYELTLKLN